MQGTGSFRLIVRRGPQPNQIYELNKDVITLGRDITNDIVINDPEVSRHHMRLTRGGGGYTIEDLGSTNGTFINGQRLTGARPLSGSDMVGLGETVTLGYESTLSPVVSADPAVPSAGTMIAPAPQNPYAAQQAGGQQSPQNPYAPPPPPPPQYQMPQDQPAGSSTARFVFLGCGCLIILCIVLAIIAVLVIDSQNLWCKLPILKNVVNILAPCPVSP